MLHRKSWAYVKHINIVNNSRLEKNPRNNIKYIFDTSQCNNCYTIPDVLETYS